MKIFPIIHLGASKASYLLLLPFCITVSYAQQVTNADDAGAGSLRDAISLASAGDTITFDAELDGSTLELVSPIVIDKAIIVDASNLLDGFTIDGNSNGDFITDAGETNCLVISDNNPSTTINVTISGITIKDGVYEGTTAGANIHNLENLTLTRCHISNGRAFDDNNSALGGGIYNQGGDLTLTECSIENNQVQADIITGNGVSSGGGIYNSGGNLTFSKCSISNNTADLGGGIYTTGNSNLALSFDHCTLAKNSAHGNGGAIFNSNSSLALTNCSLSTNYANSGGGIFQSSTGGADTVALTDSIIAGNSAKLQGPDIENTNSTFSANGFNIIGQLGNSGLIEGAAVTTTEDILLAPLGNYGGPTYSMHPLIDSPAILSDEVDITRTDQRGFTLTGPPTIGAIQVSTPTKVSDEAELRAALSASENTEGQIICFDSALDGDDIILSENSTQLEVPSNVDGLFIDASNLESGLTIDANTSETDRRRVLLINSDSTVAIQSLTISNGWTADIRAGFTNIGGGISVLDRCNTTLNHCNISNNQAGLSNVGGGLSQGRNSIMVLNYSYINHNAAGNQGGTSSQGVAGLTIPGFGGGVYSFMSKALIVNNSTISYNRAGRDGGRGGGIMTLITSVTINSSTISNNDADIGAGIRTLNPPAFIINNSTISGNFTGGVINSSDADEPGIGVSSDGSFILNNSIVAGNTEAIAFSSTEPTEIGSNILSGDPLLAPLGDYGGPTQTMPPLPGSPAINAAVESTRKTDQRGFTVSSFSDDIGAVELQLGENALELAWATDNDNDGAEFGLEFALGTDPSIANSQSDFLPFINFNDNGEPTVETNFNDNAIGAISWIIESSSDLQIWNEIYSSSNPLDNNATNLEVDTDQSVSNGVITLTDEREDTANAPNLFYRLGAELSE